MRLKNERWPAMIAIAMTTSLAQAGRCCASAKGPLGAVQAARRTSRIS